MQKITTSRLSRPLLHSLSGGKVQRLQYPGLHGLDQRDGVGHHVVPLWVVPGGLSAGLAVCHGLVTPATYEKESWEGKLKRVCPT